ncbi:MAG: hypothetical protein OXL37_13670 [Chloroflexota bacterium]|nr:hypothetical protein [Chloroflexota bacterium]MDE2959309.1 hypothetical protein [Chloroflexota bacterium]
MPLVGYFLDSNLLVLLVVGSVDVAIIPRHRRLQDYTAVDFETLRAILDLGRRIFVTPNTLTEASNLLRQHGEPERSRLMAQLRYLIGQTEEIVITSARASTNPEFQRLGLTDAALLETVSEETPLITVDLNLYLAALAKGEDMAVDFREFMDRPL